MVNVFLLYHLSHFERCRDATTRSRSIFFLHDNRHLEGQECIFLFDSQVFSISANTLICVFHIQNVHVHIPNGSVFLCTGCTHHKSGTLFDSPQFHTTLLFPASTTCHDVSSCFATTVAQCSAEHTPGTLCAQHAEQGQRANSTRPYHPAFASAC